MDSSLPIPERVFAVLAEHSGHWLCDRCIEAELGIDGVEIPTAIAQLHAESAVVLVRGRCGFCFRADFIFTASRATRPF